MRRTKKFLIGSFDDVYEVRESRMNGRKYFCVYDKREKSRRFNGDLYIGCFTLPGKMNGYVFNERLYETAGEVIDAMNTYNRTLPYDQEIDHPLVAKKYRVEVILSEYLKGLSLIMSRYGTYEYRDPYGNVLFSLFIDFKDDTDMNSTEGEVRIKMNDDTYVSSAFNDYKSAIAGCNSLISYYCILHDCSHLLASLSGDRSVMTEEKFNWAELSIKKTNALDKAIDALEKELGRLRTLREKIDLEVKELLPETDKEDI